MRPTVVSMYNYVQPIVASYCCYFNGNRKLRLGKGVAIAWYFLESTLLTQSKSKADLEGVS